MRSFFYVLIMCCFSIDALAVSPRDGRNVVNDSYGAMTGVGKARTGVNIKNTSINMQLGQHVKQQSGDLLADTMAQDVGVVEEIKIEQVDVPNNLMKNVELSRQRDICLRNNIGIGNTFVWASRNSDVSNYSMMIEDINVPENNVCFVKVAINSSDAKVKVSDIPAKYFQMGHVVKCGDWVDEDMLRKRILDAKKSARTWGIVASTVGGAAVGVGAMELFGNKLIGGAVQGQKALDGQELIVSQLKVLKKDNRSEYDRVVRAIRDLEEYCNNPAVWDGVEKPRDCDANENNFIGLLDLLD